MHELQHRRRVSLLKFGGGLPPETLLFPNRVSHKLWADFKGFLKEHQLIDKDSTLLVGVSGGPDSICLLHLLFLLRRSLNITIGVAHFDHGLRGDQSHQEQKFVQSLCQANEIEFFHAKSSTLNRIDRNLQAEARSERYRFLKQTAASHGFQSIATGHTADDQAEEMLLRLIRGAALSGLSGIPVKREDGIIRPILFLTRKRIMDHLESNQIPWIEDPSNQKVHYLRNRIRHILIPVITKKFEPGFQEKAARRSLLLKDDEAALTLWAQRETGRIAQVKTDGAGNKMVSLPLASLLKLPAAIRRRMIKHLLQQEFNLSPKDILSDHLLRIDQLCTSSAEIGGYRRYMLPRNVMAETLEYHLVLRQLARNALQEEYLTWQPFHIHRPGTYYCREGAFTLEITEQELSPPFTDFSGRNSGGINLSQDLFLDITAVEWPLLVRPKQPGDRFQPLGTMQKMRLKKFMINRKIPKTIRERIPLLVSPSGEILAVCGVEIGHVARIDSRDTQGSPADKRACRKTLKLSVSGKSFRQVITRR